MVVLRSLLLAVALLALPALAQAATGDERDPRHRHHVAAADDSDRDQRRQAARARHHRAHVAERERERRRHRVARAEREERRSARRTERTERTERRDRSERTGVCVASGRPNFDTPAGGPITRGYGVMRHPILGITRWHHGIDYAPGAGSTVRASAGGLVTFAGWAGSFGRRVVIQHGGGFESTYNHMSAITVSEGSCVRQGQRVGRVGSTGLATGPHLHFEIKRHGEFVNPARYL